MNWVFVIFVGLAVLAIGVGLWKFERHVHYDWSYRGMVEQTIHDKVKPEALK